MSATGLKLLIAADSLAFRFWSDAQSELAWQQCRAVTFP